MTCASIDVLAGIFVAGLALGGVVGWFYGFLLGRA